MHPVTASRCHPWGGEFRDITFPPSPCHELDIWIRGETELEVFAFFSERVTFQNRLILEEEEGFAIPDTKWAKSVDSRYVFECEIRPSIEDTLDVDGFHREISDVMDQGEFSIHHLFECFDLLGLDRESSCLSVSTIADKELTTSIEKFDYVAPLRGATGGDRESWVSRGLGG